MRSLYSWQNSRMKWAGHMVRMKDDKLPKRVETKKQEGSRKRGRPQLRWEVCVNIIIVCQSFKFQYLGLPCSQDLVAAYGQRRPANNSHQEPCMSYSQRPHAALTVWGVRRHRCPTLEQPSVSTCRQHAQCHIAGDSVSPTACVDLCVKRNLRKAEEEEKLREKANNRDRWKQITKVTVLRSDR